MPGFARDSCAVFVGLDDQDFRMFRHAFRRIRMDMERAEASAETEQVLDDRDASACTR